MKRIILAAFVAVLALTSCNKDNDGVAKGEQTVVIKLPNAGTKAVEGQVATGVSSTISATTNVIFLLSGQGVTATHAFSATEITAGVKYIEQVPASVDGVVVLANIPAADLTAVQALGTYTAITGYSFTAASQNSSVGITDKLMMGEDLTLTDPGTDPIGDGHDYKQADITLGSATARMEIGAVYAGTGIAAIELVAVWVNNFYPTNVATAATLYPSGDASWVTTPVAGTDASASTYTTVNTAAYNPTVYKDAANAAVTQTTTGSVYAYQVFPGNLPHVILLVKGQYAPTYFGGTVGEYFLKYVTFNKYNDGSGYISAFAANNIYKIGVGATGIEITSDMLGDNPELSQFDLGIEIDVTPWTAVNVTPEI